MIRDIILVGTGSAIGGIARFLVNRGIALFFTYTFPISTLIVNIVGSFIIGYLYSASIKQDWITSSALLFLVTGVCGGFTTFSAFSYENIMLIKNGQAPLSLIYILLSLLLGIGAAVAGFWTGK